MTHDQMIDSLAFELCGKPLALSSADCHSGKGSRNPLCSDCRCCRIAEKSQEQLDYIFSPSDSDLFLRACPGSGKTEVVGLKAAYEMRKWGGKPGGIAVLTFTNNAADIISERVAQFMGAGRPRYPHYIGTVDSWLHGYIAQPFGHNIAGYAGNRGDHSLRVVDSDSSADFLHAFETKYALSVTGRPSAHEYYSDLQDHKFIFVGSQYDHARNSMTLKDWQVDDLSKTKSRFWSKGFCTYQDIEFICLTLLKDLPFLAHALALRYRLIIVDECQDLSWVQLQILARIRAEGSKLHLVGDMNQAIYEFRKVDPSIVQDFISHSQFQALHLTSNFRSCQPIVNVCSRLVADQSVIKGHPAQVLRNACLWLPYQKENMQILAAWFEDYLRTHGIAISASVVVARNWNNVSLLRPSRNTGVNSYQKRLAMAISLWQTHHSSAMPDSLNYLGRFIAEKYFFEYRHHSREYYRPECVPSPLRWRLFLSDVLNACLRDTPAIADLSQTWTDWVACLRTSLAPLLRSSSHLIQDVSTVTLPDLPDLDGNSFRVPSKLGSAQVQKTLPTIQKTTTSIRITTIHSVKGQTVDAMMLVSAPTKQGTTDGHWTQWIENAQSEAARLAYVASSRPRHLLVWAIPESDAEQKDRLELLGLAMAHGT